MCWQGGVVSPGIPSWELRLCELLCVRLPQDARSRGKCPQLMGAEHKDTGENEEEQETEPLVS